LNGRVKRERTKFARPTCSSRKSGSMLPLNSMASHQRAPRQGQTNQSRQRHQQAIESGTTAIASVPPPYSPNSNNSAISNEKMPSASVMAKPKIRLPN
jgi:hemolysin activation/secretion protein